MPFFEESFLFSASEADLYRRMKLSAVLRHMQDAAGRHLDSLGYSYEKLMEKHQVFLLSKMEILFEGSPMPEQEVTVRTRPHPAKGAYFLRETQLEANGKPLIFGNAAWILADNETHRVLRPSAFDWDYPFDPAEFNSDIARKRIPEPENTLLLGERQIRYSDLDGNRHVNNAVYGDILCDFLPVDWMSSFPLHVFRCCMSTKPFWATGCKSPVVKPAKTAGIWQAHGAMSGASRRKRNFSFRPNRPALSPHKTADSAG